jgi:hypothetical protein
VLLEEQSISGDPRGSALRRISAAFVVGGAVSAIIASLVSVYVLGWYDSKFQQSLNSALQVELLGMAISLLIASAVFILVAAIRVRGERISSGSVWTAMILGSGFPIGLLLVARILAQFDPESLTGMITGWAYVLLYPSIVAFPGKLRAFGRA